MFIPVVRSIREEALVGVSAGNYDGRWALETRTRSRPPILRIAAGGFRNCSGCSGCHARPARPARPVRIGMRISSNNVIIIFSLLLFSFSFSFSLVLSVLWPRLHECFTSSSVFHLSSFILQLSSFVFRLDESENPEVLNHPFLTSLLANHAFDASASASASMILSTPSSHRTDRPALALLETLSL